MKPICTNCGKSCRAAAAVHATTAVVGTAVACGFANIAIRSLAFYMTAMEVQILLPPKLGKKE